MNSAQEVKSETLVAQLQDCRRCYIGGEWVQPFGAKDASVINPATEEPIGRIRLCGSADVDRAVAAASRAFESYSETSLQERMRLLQRIVEVYKSRIDLVAQTITAEMGAPITLSRIAQAPAGVAHFEAMLKLLERFDFESLRGTTLLRKEPIGVCGLITPWNWPMNQIACKVAPALAAGCTMVLKPSELSPLSAHLFAQIVHDAGVPPGVFNLVDGDGPGVGSAIASHRDIMMVSFTGSTAAGISVATAAAPTVKRVTQELGGKSANIILDDADLRLAIKQGVQACFRNSGQSCNAPTRMLVPRAKLSRATEIAGETAESIRTGDPRFEETHLGPLVSRKQFEKVQCLIAAGIDEGATLVTGGIGRPQEFVKGYFVKPTVFTDVQSDMRIAREEIFGPVLCIIPYDSENDGIRIANDTPYGLAAYVTSGNLRRAQEIAKHLRAGNVHINNARLDFSAAFGGYKQSGNGREWGEAGLNEFLELKAVFGYSGPVQN